MKPRTLKLSEDLERSLITYAGARGTSVSSVVREALEVYLDSANASEPRSMRSFATQAVDLAGCVAGPEDLSTNPVHLGAYGAARVTADRSRVKAKRTRAR